MCVFQLFESGFPMMREKRRYLLVQIQSPRRFSESDAKALFRDAVSQLLGEFGSSQSKLSLKFFDEQKQLGLLRCALSEQEKVVAAFALKSSFNGQPVALRLQKIFGTLVNTRDIFPGARPTR